MIKEEDRYSGPIYVWDSTTFWKRKNEQEKKIEGKVAKLQKGQLFVRFVQRIVGKETWAVVMADGTSIHLKEKTQQRIK